MGETRANRATSCAVTALPLRLLDLPKSQPLERKSVLKKRTG
jgi:hypothetical protein